MISIDGLAVEFGGTTLFSDISFVINEKDRIALMGKNGAGKSTLLKILAGVRQPTRGKISAPKDSVIAYLPQHLMTEDGRTVFQEAAQAFAHLHEMEAEIERLNKELETRTDYESDSLASSMRMRHPPLKSLVWRLKSSRTNPSPSSAFSTSSS